MSESDAINDKKRKIDELEYSNLSSFDDPVASSTNAGAGIINNTTEAAAKAKFLSQGLSNAQISKILIKASVEVDGAYGFLRDASALEIATRKIFVRGLGFENTIEDVKYLYSKYGPVVDCTIVTDRTTGYSKGYGFLTFQTVDSAWAAIQAGSEMMGDKQIFCNLAALGSNKKQSRVSDDTYRKIFVRGLAYECTNEVLRETFSQFGEIDHIYVAIDRATNQSKGYGFVTFARDEDASKCLESPEFEINGRNCTATLASTGSKKNTNNMAQSGGYGGGYDASAYGYGQSAYGGYGAAAAGGYGAAAGGYGTAAGGYGQQATGGYGGGYGAGYGGDASAGYGAAGGYDAGYGGGDASGYGAGYGASGGADGY